ncbi:universal stress protein [Mesonia aestuariivivens]|uniref:Universal stress protein n=1 Tax=Mesonia aestuariivivens TaxID=2796128 RepID=A0ABS6W1R6_9FLAO|nr:universal stress protein [Mesonia aestuariivivens]MBW2961797.1 universal stress protein [Mesonia aestuariivivens]
MMNILLPTDFSDNAYNAISYALNFFKDEKCNFILLNTLYNSDHIIYSSFNLIYKKNALRELNELKNKIITEFKNSNHEFELEFSLNTLYEEIESRVNNKEIDLIVMGTKGASGGKELLVGTHTVHAIQVAKCPLLVIPSAYKFRNIKHILFATKYEIDFSEYQMNLIKNFAEANNAQIHTVYANFGNEFTDNQRRAKKNLNHFLDKVAHDFNSIAKDNVPEAIEEFNKEVSNDLLVMIKHKRNFIEKILFPSIIKEIGFHTKFPFLVLPAENYDPKI